MNGRTQPHSAIGIHLLTVANARLLHRVAAEVFDKPIDPRWSQAFVEDPRHHMFLAVEEGVVVGMISAVDYVHPDKAPQLWINEVGVAATHRNQGIGRRLVRAMVEHGRTIGCTEAWLGADRSNTAARRMYLGAGGEEDKEDTVIYFFHTGATGL